MQNIIYSKLYIVLWSLTAVGMRTCGNVPPHSHFGGERCCLWWIFTLPTSSPQPLPQVKSREQLRTELALLTSLFSLFLSLSVHPHRQQCRTLQKPPHSEGPVASTYGDDYGTSCTRCLCWCGVNTQESVIPHISMSKPWMFNPCSLGFNLQSGYLVNWVWEAT